MVRAQSSWLLGLMAGLLLAAVIWFGLTQMPVSPFNTNATSNTTFNTTSAATGLDRSACLKAALSASTCYLPQPDRPGNGPFNENGTFSIGIRTYPCHCNTPESDSQNITEATPWPDENSPQPALEEWPDSDRVQTTIVATGSGSIGGRELRKDGAMRLTDGGGSDQNPAFLDEDTLVFTRFADGYNQGPAAIMGVYLDNLTEFVIWQDEAQNVNTNGNPFTPDKKQICYASDVEDTDEIWCTQLETKTRTRITHQGMDALFEPSVSSDGEAIAFEMHRGGNESSSIFVTDFSGNIQPLVDDGADNRLPQFNPADGRVLFQRRTGTAEENPFRLTIRQPDGTLETLDLPTQGGTDASWASEREIVYSSEDERFPQAKIFSYDLVADKGRQETLEPSVEDGAPAASPDGARLAFESHLTSDPDSPTRIWVIRRR
ncbi:PD40 domain-containing protein [Candidatus Micrarchaeota archaeon]|nr:PD40 domain-containing protein [Candidatus Micrarchaeota archaeon]